MKVRIEIDCTSEEARQFFGFPDVSKFHDIIKEETEKRMKEGLASMDMQDLMRMWMPGGIQGLEEMQKVFWSQMSGLGDDEKDSK